MLVDLHATTLTNIKPVVDLAAFLLRRGNSIRIPGNTRDEDTIIDYCIAALRKFNPDSRPVDYEVVYQINDAQKYQNDSIVDEECPRVDGK